MAKQLVNNLPAQRTSLIGRERDVAETRKILLGNSERLVTLTGVGGCGKTRLALQIALDVQNSFPDSVWLVELARISDPLFVPEAVATALGVPETPGQSFSDTLVASLQSRTLLIVLDNCEHLIDACALLADRLLTDCPYLRILATSREPLQIAGERQRRVRPLTAPDAGQLISSEELARFPSVQLFVERASAVEASFHLTEENAAAIARTCMLLDGIPLALELAAARMKVLSAEQIADRLDDCFRLLVGNSRSAPTRQQTLKATLDWSYDLLSEVEQLVFRRLSVFPAGWSLEAAEALCSGDSLEKADVLDVLSRLVDKSLVLVDNQGGEARFRLLEPVRQYGRQRLEVSGELEIAQVSFAEFYVDLAEQIEPELQGPGQDESLRQLSREINNIRAVLHWAGKHDDPEISLRLTGALYYYFWLSRHLHEGQRWLESALARGDGAQPKLRARGLLGLALTLTMLGEYPKGILVGQKALDIYGELRDANGLALISIVLGMMTLSQGDLATSLGLANESISFSRESGSLWQLGHALLLLGQVIHKQGDPERAVALHHEAVATLKEHGDKLAVEFALDALASIDREQVDLRRPAALAAVRQYFERNDYLSLASALEYLVGRSGYWQPETRVKILAAANSIRRNLGAPPLIGEMDEIEHNLSTAQAELDGVRFTAAWAEGSSMSIEQAVSCALTGDQAVSMLELPSTKVKFSGSLDALTRRELEVAKLLARGYTDRQIADELTITEGTAGIHVHHILEKLNFRSRVRVVDWALAQGLIDTQPD